MPKEPFKVEGSVSIDRLRDLQRRYRTEDADLRRALDSARDDLDRWLLVQRSLIANGVSIPAVRRLCHAIHDGVCAMERDLVEIRSAVRGLQEEIDEQVRRDKAPPVPWRRSADCKVQPAFMSASF